MQQVSKNRICPVKIINKAEEGFRTATMLLIEGSMNTEGLPSWNRNSYSNSTLPPSKASTKSNRKETLLLFYFNVSAQCVVNTAELKPRVSAEWFIPIVACLSGSSAYLSTDWIKRSVCRIQNSCFLHLINLPTNACWKRGYERWILLFRGWFFLPDSPVCYNWCPAYKQVACELSINCES